MNDLPKDQDRHEKWYVGEVGESAEGGTIAECDGAVSDLVKKGGRAEEWLSQVVWIQGVPPNTRVTDLLHAGFLKLEKYHRGALPHHMGCSASPKHASNE